MEQDEELGSARIFSKNFIIIASINLLIMLAYYLLFVVSAGYSMEKFATSPSISGLVAGLMVIGCMVGRFVTGHLITLFGGKKILYTGLLIYTVSMALYFAAHTLPVFIIVRFISGLGVGFVGTATGTIVAHILPVHRRGLGISYFSLSTIIGLAAGPFLGILLMHITSYQVMFGFCVGCGVIGLLIAPGLGRVEIPHGPKTSLFKLGNYIEFTILPFAAMTLCVTVCWGNLQAFVSFLAVQKNLLDVSSLFFLVYAVAVFASRPLAGMIYDKRGENIIVYPTLVLTVAGLVELAFARSGVILLVAAALLGLGVGNFQSISQVISLKMVGKARFGQATSTFFILVDIGVGFGPYFFGLLVPLTGYAGLYLASAALAACGIPLYYAVHGRKAQMALSQLS